MRWTVSIIISVGVLVSLPDYPIVATLLASAVLCGYCVWTLDEPVASWIWLYPVLCFWLSQGFTVYNFFEIGDGPAYFGVMDDILPHLLHNDYQNLFAMMTLVGPKYLNLGFLPTALLPTLLFDRPDSVVFHLTQVYTHVALVSLLLALTTQWDIINSRYKSVVFLFLLVSPGYLAMVSYPTRHHVTSFGFFLFFISFEAWLNRKTLARGCTSGIAIVLLFFCKAGLLPLLFVYVLIRVYRPAYFYATLLLSSLLIGATLYVYQYVRPLYDAQFVTETIGVFRGASLGPLMPLYKYVMAIVSPFPYYKYGVVINTIAYGGNWVLLLLFIPAGIIGLWLFGRMLLNPVRLWQYDADTKRLFAYGGILSLSILGGSTGFMMYILICMPFFAPLFRIDECNLSVANVVATLLVLNGLVLLLNGENLLDYW